MTLYGSVMAQTDHFTYAFGVKMVHAAMTWQCYDVQKFTS